MLGVGRNMKMKRFIIGPVDIQIGTKIYPSEIYVAPMDDYMLLGLDFMRRNNVVLDCSKQQITINSDVLQLSFGRSKELHMPKVSKVTLPNRTVLPPNSAVHLNGKLTNRLHNDYVIEPEDNIPVLIPRYMYSQDTTPRLC